LRAKVECPAVFSLQSFERFRQCESLLKDGRIQFKRIFRPGGTQAGCAGKEVIGRRGPLQSILARGKGIARVWHVVSGHDVSVLLQSSASPRPSQNITPHRPESAIMMSEIRVLMHASSTLIAHVADDGVVAPPQTPQDRRPGKNP
jgi:hypothetical protein